MYLKDNYKLPLCQPGADIEIISRIAAELPLQSLKLYITPATAVKFPLHEAEAHT